MDKLTIEEVKELFILKPYEIYRISQGNNFVTFFEVKAFTVDEGIKYVDLKFYDKEEIQTVEEDFFLDLLLDKNLELHAMRKEG